MTKEGCCEIKCAICDQWANSRIQFETAEAFFTSKLAGTTIRCDWCGEITPCNIGSMRYYEQKDGMAIGTYIEGKEALKSKEKKREGGLSSMNAEKGLIGSY